MCAGHVDPATLVVYARPDPTVWCNRRPKPRKEYTNLFAEVSYGTGRLTYQMRCQIDSNKVAPPRDLTKSTRDFSLKTATGWTQAKGGAKARTTMLTHYRPPWNAVREVRIAEANKGEEHAQTRRLLASERFTEELKLTLRCVVLCTIHHSIGDFFACLLYTSPSPRDRG